MKIRNGFVSNSSSSSFMMLCTYLDFEDIDLEKQNVHVIGDYLYDGQDIFQVTPEMLEFLKTTKHMKENLEFVDLHFFTDGDGWIERKNIPEKGCAAKSGYIDYHTTETVEQLKERYGKNVKEY